jgi:hypothetical protein
LKADQHELLDANLRVPQHVVFRGFPTETVVLNLQTGKYHGLNPTAGRMLEAISEAASIRDAAAGVAAEYEQPADGVERDMCVLCEAMLERGLIEIDEAGAD